LEYVNVRPENIYIPDSSVPVEKVSQYCHDYEAKIAEVGGLDLMLLGVGSKGQIGFNEAGSYSNSKTRMVALSNASIQEEASAFASIKDVPTKAITMGIGTILSAKQIVLVAWGENKASVIGRVIEGAIDPMCPATYLQNHNNIEVVIDEEAAEELTREKAPWLVGTCDWSPKFIRKAVIWLAMKTQKPILKLTYKDYIDNSLGQLLEAEGTFDAINIKVFNDLQHTISGWPGGKPNADDSTRPERATPYPKRVIIFSPHPDDDVISMGGTFMRLTDQGHDVHVAYQVSGNVAVHDDVIKQFISTAREMGLGDRVNEVNRIINTKRKGEPEPRALLELKGAMRRGEALGACSVFGVKEENIHFLDLPFYESGGIKKNPMGQADIDIIVKLLREVKPHQIFAAGDLADPHGTHRVCIDAILGAVEQVKDEEWMKDCRMWLYRGAWMEWGLDMVDMAVPLSPDEVIKKRHAIYRHLSQKDLVPFPGEDPREFWQRAEERTQTTAMLYDKLGMAEYQALEVFVRMF
jgi:glucosamine-6-phosphate deaminase